MSLLPIHLFAGVFGLKNTLFLYLLTPATTLPSSLSWFPNFLLHFGGLLEVSQSCSRETVYGLTDFHHAVFTCVYHTDYTLFLHWFYHGKKMFLKSSVNSTHDRIRRFNILGKTNHKNLVVPADHPRIQTLFISVLYIIIYIKKQQEIENLNPLPAGQEWPVLCIRRLNLFSILRKRMCIHFHSMVFTLCCFDLFALWGKVDRQP